MCESRWVLLVVSFTACSVSLGSRTDGITTFSPPDSPSPPEPYHYNLANLPPSLYIHEKRSYDTGPYRYMQDWAKRNNMGFLGMRGKKWPEDDLYDKRTPMGFNGMRGKKDSFLIDEDDFEKRAMGFNGMRGKKDFIEEEMEKRGSMGFNGMRGKKDDYLDDLEKRAMGFNGMRGKKFDWDVSEEKRAKSMGFNGMRGKKDDFEREESVKVKRFAEDGAAVMEKRSVFGLRGSKETPDLGFKRAMGFLGMRGKKMDRH